MTSFESANTLIGAFNLGLTFVLTLAAIIAGILAFRNINFLKEQRRSDTLLELMNRMASQRERDNRALVNNLNDAPVTRNKNETTANYVARLIKHSRTLRGTNISEQKTIRYKEGIEETISCLDIIGFFLLGDPPDMVVDPKLEREAPDWIWRIAVDIWSILGDYVIGIQNGTISRDIEANNKPDPTYGKYFHLLATKAEKRRE